MQAQYIVVCNSDAVLYFLSHSMSIGQFWTYAEKLSNNQSRKR
jgi:hypothetical protein